MAEPLWMTNIELKLWLFNEISVLTASDVASWLYSIVQLYW